MARQGITSKYRSLGELLDAYTNGAKTVTEKEKLVVGLQGSGGSNKVGLTTSKRLYDFLMSEDPDYVVT